MSKNRKIKDPSPRSEGRRREVVGAVALGAPLFLLVAMISLQAGTMVMGPFGRSAAGLFYGVAGLCGYLIIALAVIAAVRTLLERAALPLPIAIGAAIGIVSLAMLIHLAASG